MWVTAFKANTWRMPVRGLKHVVKTEKATELDAEQACQLLDSIHAGLRCGGHQTSIALSSSRFDRLRALSFEPYQAGRVGIP